MVTVPDFSVPHTQFWCLWKEDPLGFTIHHPELIMLKNIKSYSHWSALIKIVPHWIFFLFHIKIHEISPGAIQKSNGLKVTCLMSLYFKSEEDTMKNEIPAAIFLARIQIINLPCIFDFFFLVDFILFGTLSATKSCCFFTTKTLFLSVICSITDTNNNSPSRDEM